MITYSILNSNSEPVGQKMTITGALLFLETLARTYTDEPSWILYKEEEEEAPVEEQKEEPYVPEIVKGLLGNPPEATEEVPAEEQ